MSKLKQLRIRCFFDVSIAQDKIGRIVFELFNDVCPKTCENFKALCTGEKGSGKFTGKPLHYKNCKFHRVVKNFMIQSGDFSQGNGKGGESIYGGTFEDEAFDIKHEKPFLLSMANRGKNTNGSQFFITLAPAPHLDGVHVVFGHVISGQDVVMQIANQAVDKSSRPLVEISISNCGELIPQIKSKSKSKKASSSASESNEESSSDSSESSSSDSDSSSEDSDSRTKKENDAKQKDAGPIAIPISNLPNAPKVYANIKPDEIPEVPANRFLSRNFKPKEQEKRKEEDNKIDRSQNRRDIRVSYTKSGRKIKGRGLIRYRTPSPRDREDRFRRSETPPHWKNAQSRLKSFKEVVSGERNKSHEDKPSRSKSIERYRRRRSRSRSRERHSHRYNRYDTSRRDRRTPDRDRPQQKRSLSPNADGDKRQKENLNGNSHYSNKASRDRYRDDATRTSRHERSSSSEKSDGSPPRRNKFKSVISSESKRELATSS